jgi:hypothetical protein
MLGRTDLRSQYRRELLRINRDFLRMIRLAGRRTLDAAISVDEAAAQIVGLNQGGSILLYSRALCSAPCEGLLEGPLGLRLLLYDGGFLPVQFSKNTLV